MKLQSMTNFVLQGIDEIDLKVTFVSRNAVRYSIIEKYAEFLQRELKPDQFDPKNPECLFVGYKVWAGDSEGTYIVQSSGKSGFFLGFNKNDNMTFNDLEDELCIGTVEALISFCDNYGYELPELTDYAKSKFL